MTDVANQRPSGFRRMCGRWVPRWLRGVLSWMLWPVIAIAFFYLALDNRGASHYEVPRLEDALHVSGVLKPAPEFRSSRAPITVQAGDQDIRLGCSPNFKYTIGCLPLEMRKALAGKNVSVRYFHYDDARNFENVLLQLESGGQVYVRYDESARYLTAQREKYKLNPTGGAVVFGLILGLLVTAFEKFVALRRRRQEL